MRERPLLPGNEAAKLVVIGFGNTLRRDDAVGYQIARQAERLWSPRLRAIALQQLTPEVAAELAEADRAIFVDARPTACPLPVCAEEIEPLEQGSASLVHAITPRFLLGLCQALYGRSPRSWMIAVPALDFRFGEELSVIAQEGIPQALAVIETLLAGPAREPGFSAACPASDRLVPASALDETSNEHAHHPG